MVGKEVLVCSGSVPVPGICKSFDSVTGMYRVQLPNQRPILVPCDQLRFPSNDNLQKHFPQAGSRWRYCIGRFEDESGLGYEPGYVLKHSSEKVCRLTSFSGRHHLDCNSKTGQRYLPLGPLQDIPDCIRAQVSVQPGTCPRRGGGTTLQKQSVLPVCKASPNSAAGRRPLHKPSNLSPFRW